MEQQASLVLWVVIVVCVWCESERVEGKQESSQRLLLRRSWLPLLTPMQHGLHSIASTAEQRRRQPLGRQSLGVAKWSLTELYSLLEMV